jgi:hypothetical protein
MILSVCRAGDEKRWEGANFNITNERQSMVNSGAGTAYPSGAHEFTRGFIGVDWLFMNRYSFALVNS